MPIGLGVDQYFVLATTETTTWTAGTRGLSLVARIIGRVEFIAFLDAAAALTEIGSPLGWPRSDARRCALMLE